MIALQLLPILQLIIILCNPTLSYPIYGTKRYGRAIQHHTIDPYDTMYRHPLNYYKVYPYGQPDDYYYPQELLYYPRTSKYEVYQAVLPYYYQERIPSALRPKYYGYNDPVVDVQEEMLLQQAEREEREDAQPIGHELLYETATDDTNNADMDAVNTAFLQNLIMTQMYQDAMDKETNYYDMYADYDDGQWTNDRSTVDKDVEELKQLAKPQPTHKVKQADGGDVHWFQKSSFRNQNRNIVEQKRNIKENEVKQGVMMYTDRRPIVKPSSTTSTVAPTSVVPKKLVARGQKEEVLMRPATPVRRPFSTPVLEMLQNNKRTPSVYDTIKHMLDMEKSLENTELRPTMKKRIISSEESLARQLSVLKKAQ